ncbi:MAG TPA: ankyrin repeat domain-containing protein, partial [Pyrinomonadaceae bacterium]|nr:ankyrin repeat domain-containing protein [Pyrinomonadaceae bacterium]
MSAAVPRVTNLVRETNQLTQEAATDPSTGPDTGSAVQVPNVWPADASSINEHGMTPLMRAAFEGSAGTVRALLHRGAELEAKRTDGLNALSLAAFFGHSQVVWILLEHGADLAATGRAGT